MSDILQQQARDRGQIGYYNPNAYPIQFASSQAGRGPVTLDPMEPLVRGGNLVDFDADAEACVGMKMLRPIHPKDPNFAKYKDFNQRGAKQRGTVTYKGGDIPIPDAPAGPTIGSRGGMAPPPQPPATMPVSAQAADAIPSDATIVLTGGVPTIQWRGKTFPSIVALQTYMDTVGA